MKAKFNVNKTEKKELIGLISKKTGCEATYNKVPRCSYNIGEYELERGDILVGPDNEELLKAIKKAGFSFEVLEGVTPKKEKAKPEAPKELKAVEISLPRKNFDDESLKNLMRLIEAKGELIKRAFECESTEIKIDKNKITFPWFKVGSSLETKAFTEFVAALGDMAIKQKSVSVKPKEIVNEKYEFRCFLLRLGFIGAEYKDTRKVLLMNLSGSAAFKSGQKGVSA